MDQHCGAPPGPSEGARRVTGDGPGQGIRRFSARRKVESVLRLLRGEDLELLSRELGVTAAAYRSGGTSFSGPARRN